MNSAAKSVKTADVLDVENCIDAALKQLRETQATEGCWKGDYGGPLFLLPMFVATHYIIGREIGTDKQPEMVRYLYHHQNDDGGWGLHIEGQSQLFTTVLCYVALRLLNESADQLQITAARQWIQSHGSALRSPLWGKFQLALLNLFDYSGIPPVPPELWLLPRFLPIHPSRFWCHSRMVLLPMTYLYGRRCQIPVDDRIKELRTEIYSEPYESIQWSKHRSSVSPTDEYTPATRTQRFADRLLLLFEPVVSLLCRKRALRHVLDHVRQEDENTNFICIGPVNKQLNTLCYFFTNPDGPEVHKHIERLDDYLWCGTDGIKMNGYNSSRLWDTAFAVQAVSETRRVQENQVLLQEAHNYVDANQVLDDTPNCHRYYRHASRGGWPFSDRAHGWPISDCTAEGLKACLLVENVVDNPVSETRLRDAVELILSLQNRDGGWATYERTRGPRWLEKLNATTLFADVMVDYSYVECTSACIQALANFGHRYPNVLRTPIEQAIRQGRDFILNSQRRDGSWVGSWGICFTYGTWFGVWGLRAAGMSNGESAVQNACEFLLEKQLPDGGWGETAESCRQLQYVSAAHGQAVMTSWALLALMQGGHSDSEAVGRGIEFLIRRQNSDGTWPPEHIAGVFNKTCAIHYDNYLKIFPLWALARFTTHVSESVTKP